MDIIVNVNLEFIKRVFDTVVIIMKWCNNKKTNHPFVVWAACFLWLTSMFDIAWSLLLFFCVGDLLLLTGTDLVNAFVLLSGIIMLPTNVHMLYAIAHNQKINHKSKTVCCPLWLCIIWIILVNLIGAALCIQRIYSCQSFTYKTFFKSMKSYRSSPNHRHIVDKIQWSLKCCGLKSYKDWFNKDWCYNRDYGSDMIIDKRYLQEVDSVPLSCCKSGHCAPNYIKELGASTINTNGCVHVLYHVVIISMMGHAVMFLSVVVVEILIMKFIVKGPKVWTQIKKPKYNIHRIMSVKDNFDVTSESYQAYPNDSEDGVATSPASEIKRDIYK